MTNLRYNLYAAGDVGEMRHAQIVVEELGITYRAATPQSIADEWWFWDCANVPDPLPPYLSPLSVSPHRAIGNGLSQEDADWLVGGTP